MLLCTLLWFLHLIAGFSFAGIQVFWLWIILKYCYMLFYFIKKLALELGYGLPLLTQACLFKSFPQKSLSSVSRGHLIVGQRKNKK